VGPKTDVELSGELEQIAAAAAERLRALVAGGAEREVDLQRRVGEAASRGIAAGLSLAGIADAEQIGHGRAREELGPQLLRRVERAARRKREAELEYEEAIALAGRLGLVHRNIAAAAQVAHGRCARSSRARRRPPGSAPRQTRARPRTRLRRSRQTGLRLSMSRLSKRDPPTPGQSARKRRRAPTMGW